DPEYGGAVADDARVRGAVAAELRRVGVNVHELRVGGEAAEAKAEVERRPDHAHDVGRGQSGTAGVLEEERVLGRQRAPAGAVEVDRQASVLGEGVELLPCTVPQDAAAGDDGGPLGVRE